MTKKIYIIAGETSGDFIAAQVVATLKNLTTKNLEFIGVGGKALEAEGVRSLFNIEHINIMGFIEIIPNLIKINNLLNQTFKDIERNKPELLITVDSPGFTCRVAKMVRKAKMPIKIIHIVAPTVWAYKEERAKKYAQIYDHLLVLLPFEPPYFHKYNLKCDYIGHPILEQSFITDKKLARERLNINDNKKIICVTPGSRPSEIIRHLPIFCHALSLLSKKVDLLAIFVLAKAEHQPLFTQIIQAYDIPYIITTERLTSFAAADLALAKCGTNILEIAASDTPLVTTYKVNPLSYLIIKAMIKIKYISLINIIADKMIIPELIQNDCNALSISKELHELLLDDKLAQTQLQESNKILAIFKDKGLSAPSKAARIILNYI